MADSAQRSATADVAVRPPVLILGALLAASLLEIAAPLGPGLGQGTVRPILIGLALAVIGGVLFGRAHAAFARVGNAVSPRQPTLNLVTGGVYGWSRNPVYVALLAVYFGLAVALTTVWGLILLPVVVAVFNRAIIDPEEAYLGRRFGDAYRVYARRVPRWL